MSDPFTFVNFHHFTLTVFYGFRLFLLSTSGPIAVELRFIHSIDIDTLAYLRYGLVLFALMLWLIIPARMRLHEPTLTLTSTYVIRYLSNTEINHNITHLQYN